MKMEEKYNYGGWENCIRLYNDEVELIVTTDVGPRIIRFGFIGGKNMFGEFENQIGKKGGNEYKVYGGTRIWHGPEANPRCYFPDNESVKYKYDENSLILQQALETTTGMQKEIKISIDSNKNQVSLTYIIHNKNLWDIEFSPWVLSIMNLGGRGIIPQEPFQAWEERLTPVRPLVLWGYTTMDDPRWKWSSKYIQLKHDPKSKTRQKIGVLNTMGWAAYYLDGELFLKRYKYNPDANYTDFGVNTEVYSYFDNFELETIGEFRKVPAGGYAEHKENWYLFKVSVNETDESIDNEVLPLVKKTSLPD
jgi:hypothetical protein